MSLLLPRFIRKCADVAIPRVSNSSGTAASIGRATDWTTAQTLKVGFGGFKG